MLTSLTTYTNKTILSTVNFLVPQKPDIEVIKKQLPGYYGKGYVEPLLNRAKALFTLSNLQDKDLTQRVTNWSEESETNSQLTTYAQGEKKTALYARKGPQVIALKDKFPNPVDEFFGTKLAHNLMPEKSGLPPLINTASFYNETKGEVLRSFFVTFAYSFIDTITGQVKGVFHIAKILFKALAAGVIKGYINKNIVLDILSELISESLVLLIQDSFPFIAGATGKTALKSGLRKTIDQIKKREISLLFKEDIALETAKGAFKGSMRTFFIELLNHNTLGSILGPICAVMIMNIFITQAFI